MFDPRESRVNPPNLPKWLIYALIFGLFLTLRGYHSRDGDQAYRLPILLHQQDQTLFADDPFVTAFQTFNPHQGYLALMHWAGRPLGLSAGLAGLFALTFVLTCFGLDRLTRGVWGSDAHAHVGILAIALVLIAKAGNVGTNHLFEAMLLDRLIGLAIGWLAIGSVVLNPKRGQWVAPPMMAVALWIHPSMGLQITCLLCGGWLAWACLNTYSGVGWALASRSILALGLAVAPGLALNLGQGGELFKGLSPEEFRLLSVELQGPQHMLPHLWRMPQWLAWGCYVVLAFLALISLRTTQVDRPGETNDPRHPGQVRTRFAILLGVNLVGLALAWVAVEWVEDLRVTIFQPFRMATVFRGLALVLIAGLVNELWSRATWTARARATLLVVGLAGDWSLVIATLVEVSCRLLEQSSARFKAFRLVPAGLVLGWGLYFLARHDTESGHWPILLALGFVPTIAWRLQVRGIGWNLRRLAWATAFSWAVPLAAIAASGEAANGKAWALALVDRCRFAAVPVDDVERLAVWCRDHTPTSARFIGPPGPKTFRLWSLRPLAFNRASSPYHAQGLADWSARFRDHVGFTGDTRSFVQAYLKDRHALERRYQTMSDRDRADLARRQGATHLIAAAPAKDDPSGSPGADSPLELLHVEGRYAAYRVLPLSQNAAGPEKSGALIRAN